MQISPHLHCFEDTCNVYAILSGDTAILIDFGDGSILSKLAAVGASRVSDVLMTHHHRDQGQGLALAVQAGARIWVPHTEQDLFQEVDLHWQGRAVYNNYDVRQDRFSLLEPVRIAGTLHDYARLTFGSPAEPVHITVVPTPGHTPGSISLMAEIDGAWVAFTGDLISAPGKVWSMAATQWTYNGAEGVAASIASLVDLKQRGSQVLLPSHGEPICEPGLAIDLLIERLQQVLDYRWENPRLRSWLKEPFVKVTPHLLLNRTCMANSYVLLSESGKALLIDFGYDFMTGAASGADRASRRPWLYTLGALKRDFSVQQIEAAIPTHYHDDHVAGLNLLREVEGTQVWAAESFADILEHPSWYDLPCLWYDPIPVDQVLPVETPLVWNEYELTLHRLPGHTQYAVAIDFRVDGRRVVATGDQYQSVTGLKWNYVYQNRFRSEDYRLSAELLCRLRPDLVISGHWDPIWVTPEYLQDLMARGEALERLHCELLPQEVPGLGVEGFGARIQPYQSQTRAGEPVTLAVEVHNPFASQELVVVRLAAPVGWLVEPPEIHATLGACEATLVQFNATPPAGLKIRRARLAADLTVGGRRFGQQAETLITVV